MHYTSFAHLLLLLLLLLLGFSGEGSMHGSYYCSSLILNQVNNQA